MHSSASVVPSSFWGGSAGGFFIYKVSFFNFDASSFMFLLYFCRQNRNASYFSTRETEEEGEDKSEAEATWIFSSPLGDFLHHFFISTSHHFRSWSFRFPFFSWTFSGVWFFPLSPWLTAKEGERSFQLAYHNHVVSRLFFRHDQERRRGRWKMHRIGFPIRRSYETDIQSTKEKKYTNNKGSSIS